MKAVYADFRREKGTYPEAYELAGRSKTFYWSMRDLLLDEWAVKVWEKKGLKLLDFQEQLFDLLEKADLRIYAEVLAGEVYQDEDGAYCMAYCIAILRWINKANAGRFPFVLEVSAEEAQQWLDDNAMPVSKNAAQPSLFLGV